MNFTIKNLPVLVALSTFLLVAQTNGQDLANDIINQVNNNGGPANPTPDLGQPTNGPGGGPGDAINFAPDFGGIFDMPIPVTPDERQMSGFVGASESAERGENFDNLNFRFIGVVNDGGPPTATTAPTPNRGPTGGPTDSAPRVERARPVRARLVPRFSAPQIAPAAVSARVNQRLSSLPSTRRIAGSMNVSVQGRTAFVNTSRLSQQQANRISRQLRLEPGIRRVVRRGR